jgi:HD-GYP domain-containing protein (c-di-GMP phosphodiesterase class II)
MSEEEISVLAYAARIHDVGMAHVSPGILHEPGQLDPDAWAHVAEHPARAVELLKPIEFHSQVTEIILAHHERIDGRGYPRGLRGEQIPLGARIIAAVDAYESMTLGRPYRQPMSHEDAVAELQSHRGTQFDEGVVDAFVEVMTTQQDIPPFPTPEAAESGR